VVIDVNLYDEIDFVCPHYSSLSASAAASAADNRVDQVVDDVSRRSLEYYVVYQVSACVHAASRRILVSR